MNADEAKKIADCAAAKKQEKARARIYESGKKAEAELPKLMEDAHRKIEKAARKGLTEVKISYPDGNFISIKEALVSQELRKEGYAIRISTKGETIVEWDEPSKPQNW